MKTLRFIGMALTAIMLTIGFTACSSDDDDNNGGNGEKYTKLWYAYNPGTEKYGYINENGDFAIAAQYDNAKNFSCGRAKVETGGKYYFIDTNGKIINATGFDDAKDFTNNYAAVEKDGLWGLIDKNGNFVIQPQYNALRDVATNGLLAFQIQSGGKWGFINTKNDRSIAPEYEYTKTFNNGVACVKSGNKWGAINAEGKWVIAPTYNQLYPVIGKDLLIFSEKSSGSSSSLYGIMDYNGNIKVQALYSNIYANETGCDLLAAENTNGKFGFIDLNGNTAIPFEYDDVTDFQGNYAGVAVKKSAGSYEYTYSVIDRSGKVLYSLGEKERCDEAYNGMMLVKKYEEGKTTYTYHRVSDNKTIYTWTK